MSLPCRPPAGPALWGPPLALLAVLAVVWGLDWNTPLFLWLNHLGGGDPGWAGVTLFGEPLTALTLGLVCSVRRPRAGWALVLGGLAAALAVNLAKTGLGLPRPAAVLPPEGFHLVGETLRWRAFPSGHTATAFLFAAVVFWCADFRALRLGAVALAVLAGVSRITMGVHWPLDVLAGAAVGWLCGALGVWAAARIDWLDRPAGHRLLYGILAAAALALPFYRPHYPGTEGLQTALAVAALAAAALGWWRRRAAQ